MHGIYLWHNLFIENFRWNLKYIRLTYVIQGHLLNSDINIPILIIRLLRVRFNCYMLKVRNLVIYWRKYVFYRVMSVCEGLWSNEKFYFYMIIVKIWLMWILLSFEFVCLHRKWNNVNIGNVVIMITYLFRRIWIGSSFK